MSEYIGDYKVLEKVAAKEMGILYKGMIGERTVFIKVIPTHMTKDEEFKERFLREMEVISKLNHPNIVQAFDFGMEVETGLYYLVYECVAGETLLEGLSSLGKFPVPMALRIVWEVAKGLDHAFVKEVIHRKINPENIFLGEDGSVKITHFGLAKFVSKSSITRAGTILGAPTYISPEQALPEGEVDIRSDIYSLGITLYHMLAGRPPFVDPIPMRLIHAHCHTPLPPIGNFVENIPEEVEHLIQKMTAKNPDHRFLSPAKLIESISHLASYM